MFNWKTALIVSGSVVVCGIAMLYMKKKNTVFVRKRKRSMNEILFYGSNRRNLSKVCVMCMVCDAEVSVDVCLPRLTNEVLAKNLMNLTKEKPVKIRILVHKEKIEPDSLISKLKDGGIEVKCGIDEDLCHEFVIIDATNDPVLMMGALDRPMRDSGYLQENAVLTSEPASVGVFVNEFERLWAAADENPDWNLNYGRSLQYSLSALPPHLAQQVKRLVPEAIVTLVTTINQSKQSQPPMGQHGILNIQAQQSEIKRLWQGMHRQCGDEN
ncbi:Mitochondrial cardiolipin hydrolase [Eumeta japonica]|uniref:Mitochondrial cardiolipin hydrolase n=1 Tax=Eumeta variegata TaxID=151549 RepID=A0A4C1UQ22_EUMVA|nr:Mitochondrial cardiolipin hydrolase [Eumeta japonica]